MNQRERHETERHTHMNERERHETEKERAERQPTQTQERQQTQAAKQTQAATREATTARRTRRSECPMLHTMSSYMMRCASGAPHQEPTISPATPAHASQQPRSNHRSVTPHTCLVRTLGLGSAPACLVRVLECFSLAARLVCKCS